MEEAKRKQGRPRIPDTDRASEWLPGIRVTAADNERYRAAAQAAGLPLGHWVRNVLAKAVKASRRKKAPE